MSSQEVDVKTSQAQTIILDRRTKNTTMVIMERMIVSLRDIN